MHPDQKKLKLAPVNTTLWTWGSFSVIALFFLSLLIRWPLLPNFMDIYYHLLIGNEFNLSGGFVTHDFLQYAPAGRQHLYPPVFHLLIMVLFKSGLTPLFIAKFTDAAAFPLLLITIWFFMRTLFHPRIGFFAVLLAASLYSFYLASTNFIPATLSLIFGLLSLVCLEKNKLISSSILLGIGFYTQAQIPWVMVIAFLLYGIFNREKFKKSLFILAGAIAMALPILVYMFKNRHFYAGGLNYENFVIDFSLIIILFILAIPIGFKRNPRYYILLALALSAVPFIRLYPYRFISGQGSIGLIFLAAVGADNLYDSIQTYLSKNNPGKRRPLFTVMFIAMAVLFSPSFAFKTGENMRFGILNSTYINLTTPQKQGSSQQFRSNDYSISSSKFISEIIKCIKKNTSDTGIIYANIDLTDTMLASLSGRACAKGMLKEVLPYIQQDPLQDSELIVWFKNYENDLDGYLATLIAQNKLVQIKETEIARIYKNPSAHSKPAAVKPALPKSIILGICMVLTAFLLYDLFGPSYKHKA